MRLRCAGPRAVGVVLAAVLVAGSATPGPVTAFRADSPQASIQERLARVRADLFSRIDRYPQSIEELKAILAIDPRSVEGHVLLGIAYRGLGSQDFMGEAVAEFRQALALDPRFAPARLYLAHVYLDLGRAQRAREEMETALAQAPGNPQFLAMLGEAERQLGNPQKAVDVLRQALKADESAAQARYYLALALFDLDQRGEAIRELERVVQSGATAVEAYLSLGTAYIDAGRVDDALTTLSQVSKSHPTRPDIRIQLARAYRSKSQLDKADEQLALARPAGTVSVAAPFAQQQQGEFDFYLELGLLRLRQGRLEAAADAFQKVLDIDPNHAGTKRHLADVKARLQKKKAGGKG